MKLSFRSQRTLILVLAALVVGPAARAQVVSGEDSVDSMREEIRELRERLVQLEERMAAASAGPSSTAPPSEVPVETETEPVEQAYDDSSPDVDEEVSARPRSHDSAFFPSRGWLEGMYYGIAGLDVEVHAFIDTEFVDAGPDGSRGGKSTFDSHHANIFVEAEIRPDLDAHAEFEFEHSGDLVEVDQAYLAWAATDYLTLEAGRFYEPFGIERFVWYSPTNLLVSRPEPMRQILPGNFYGNGLMVAGVLGDAEGSRFSYEVAVTNGLGNKAAVNRRDSRQTRDNNNNKAVTGRVSWLPNRNLELGTSFHDAQYDDDGELGFSVFGLDVSSRWRGWQLRGEYVDAEIERSAQPALGQSGWYAQLGYTFSWLRERVPDLTLVSRYDVVDLNDAVRGSNDQEFWSLGVNTSVYDHFRVKLEYRFASDDGPPRDDDTFLGQLVVDF